MANAFLPYNESPVEKWALYVILEEQGVLAWDIYIQDIITPKHPKTMPEISHIYTNKKPAILGRFVFWWGTYCAIRAKNKQEFAELLHNIKTFNEK